MMTPLDVLAPDYLLTQVGAGEILRIHQQWLPGLLILFNVKERKESDKQKLPLFIKVIHLF